MRKKKLSRVTAGRKSVLLSVGKLSLFFTLLLLCFLVFQHSAIAEERFIDLLRAQMPGAQIVELPAEPPYQNVFEIRLAQPLDHGDPDGETFTQYIYLWHLGGDRPTIFETHGYWVNTRWDKDLSRLMDANHISVEHRYFGQSKPQTMDYEYLNISQIVRDYHRIAEMLKPIYKEKWLSTGISKGGQTALAYRRFYPEDVDATVAYVAPMNLNREDHRTDRHIEKVGTDACRDLMWDFQRIVLERRDEMLPLLAEYSRTSGLTFTNVGLEVALEYSAMEYTFSFWQWGDGDCSVVPGRHATDQQIFDHLLNVSGFYLYCDQGMETYAPMFYQNMREWGYYGFITYHLRDLLEERPYPDNAEFAPLGVDISYQRHVLQDILNWLDHNGNNIIYVNGANDPWAGPAVELSGKTNAIRFDVEGGNHGARIADLSIRQKRVIYRHLEQWMGIRIDPAKKEVNRNQRRMGKEDRGSMSPESRRGFLDQFVKGRK